MVVIVGGTFAVARYMATIAFSATWVITTFGSNVAVGNKSSTIPGIDLPSGILVIKTDKATIPEINKKVLIIIILLIKSCRQNLIILRIL